MLKHAVLPLFLLSVFVIFFIGCGNDKTNKSIIKQQQNDHISPTLSLVGDKTVTLFLGENFIDPGVIAQDNVDGNITHLVTTSSLNLTEAGTQTLIYHVSDTAGNTASIKREIIIYEQTHDLSPRSGLKINEILAANASITMDPLYKNFSDYIELYNNSSEDITLDGYALSDDKKSKEKWTFPSRTRIKAHGYLLIWADKEDHGLHTNFSLNADGESLSLYDRDGDLIDEITFGKQKSDISCTKMDGKLYSMQPTPNKVNTSTAMIPAKRTKKPSISKDSGFYQNSLLVTLSQKDDAPIYYTLDGSKPTTQSRHYTAPLNIDHTTVLRARAYDRRFLPSKVSTHTYLVDEDVRLPVISIAVNPNYLYDDKIGIFVAGTDDNGHKLSTEPSQFRKAHYDQDWERPAHFEYFANKKAVLSKNIGIKTHGRYSRALAQKSFNIYSRGKYDSKYIKYPLFPHKPQVKKIKSFTLRNSGGDWGRSMLKDAMAQSIVRDTMHLDYQDYQPTVLFVNGHYVGIQNIRERNSGELIRSNRNIKTKNMDLLAKTVQDQEVYEGDNKDYAAMIEYIEEHGVEKAQDYNYIKSKIDIENYTNYMIAEMFFGCDDWPLNNNKYWRERTSSGKWRWILFDTDSGFASYKMQDNPFDYLLRHSGPSSGKNTPEATFLFRSMMKNSDFKRQFIAKFKSHLNTTFKSARMLNIINDMANTIKPEMSRHIGKWRNTYSGRDHRADTLEEWGNIIDQLRRFAKDRPELMERFIKDEE